MDNIMDGRTLEELFKLKLKALLHDPYWKVFDIKEHEEGVKSFIRDRLNSILIRKFGINLNDTEFEDPVKNADRLSSSFDRFPISFYEDNKLAYELSEKYRSDNKILYNIFSLKFEGENTHKPEENRMDLYNEIITKLGSLQNIRDIRDFYINFWTWLEIKIINKYGYALPQDTRISMFDILDHIYSTASLINLTYKKEGFVILFDIPAIQKFVIRGRKLRDQFVGSWILSFIMFKFLEKIAYEFGPDTIVSPTLRLNPFWIYSVKKGYSIDELWEEYRNLGLIDDDWYRYALIPATAEIVLPKIEGLDDENKVKEFLLNKFEKALSETISNEIIVDAMFKFIEEFRNKNLAIDISREEIENYLKNIFIPRITIVKVDKDDFEKANKDIIIEGRIKFSSKFMFWTIINEKLREKIRKLPKIKLDPAEISYGLLFSKKIKEMYNRNQRIELCSNCGRLPAIVHFDRDRWDEIKKVLLGLKISPTLFKPGERLCVVCLAKRITSIKISDILNLKRNFGESFDQIEFPTTEEVTILPMILYIIHTPEEKISQESLNLIEKLSEECINKLNIKELNIRNHLERLLDFYNNIVDNIVKKIKDDKLVKRLEKLKYTYALARLYKDPDLIFNFIEKENCKEEYEKFPEKIRKVINEFLSELKDKENLDKELVRVIITSFTSKYYSIIYADGDNIGELISGKLDKALFYKTENIYEEIVKNMLRKSINENIAIDVSQKVKKLMAHIKNSNENDMRPLSISYQFSISRSLIISSLLEVKEIKKLGGLVIYAGGDDLLVISPKDSAMDIINKSREMFAGEYNGWHVIKGTYFIAGLGYVGRTYSVCFAHYKDPLYIVLESVRENEKKKKDIKYKINNKDSSKNIAIFYYTRSPNDRITIPFYFKENNNEFSVEFPVYKFIKKLLEIQESVIFKELNNVRDILAKGRIYSILDEYEKELLYLINYGKIEEAKKLLKNILSKSIEKEHIDKILGFLDLEILIENDTENRHILFEILRLLKILMRNI